MNILRGIHPVVLVKIRRVVSLGSLGPFSITGANVTTNSLSKSSPAVQNKGSVMAPATLKSIAWWRQCGDAGGCGPSDATMTGRVLLVCVVAVLSGVGTAWCNINLVAWVSLVWCFTGFCSTCYRVLHGSVVWLFLHVEVIFLARAVTFLPCLLLRLLAFTFKNKLYRHLNIHSFYSFNEFLECKIKKNNIWRMKDQLDVTWYFISLIMCSTCFRH